MFRSPKLLESARDHECQNCGSEDGTVVWAHSNQGEHGKGKSIKAHDIFGAFLCFRCHSWLDQGSGFDPTGRYTDDRASKAEMWRRAHDKTLLRLVETGKLRVA